jgi:hypothetical protein
MNSIGPYSKGQALIAKAAMGSVGNFLKRGS